MSNNRETGNAAAIRKSLKASRDYFVALRESVPGCLSEQYLTQRIADIDAALSAPPRNCDVGNAADQERRFQDFCHAHRTASTSCMRTCPGYNAHTFQRCQAIWAQLPYQEGGAE